MKSPHLQFSNLLGTVYRQGNLLFTPDGNCLLSPVGNRVSVFDLVQSVLLIQLLMPKEGITKSGINCS